MIKDLERELLTGKVIIYPTDTVYGVGASIYSKEGIEKIYRIKKRDLSSPIIALLSEKKDIEKIAIIDDEKRDIYEKLIKKYWPGALTIILKRKKIVPDIMVANGETVGVRIPELEESLEIIKKAGGILATTSANFSGKKTPRNYEELDQEFIRKGDIIIEYKDKLLGIESTIIDLSSSEYKIIREGAIKKSELEKYLELELKY